MLVDAFNGLGLAPIGADELLPLVVDPRRLFEQKVEEGIQLAGADSAAYREAMEAVDWEPVAEAESGLMSNPYTVHQNMNFTGIAPLSKVYALVDGKVTIQAEAAKVFAEKERLSSPEFDMDNLAVWDRVLSPEEVAGFLFRVLQTGSARTPRMCFLPSEPGHGTSGMEGNTSR